VTPARASGKTRKRTRPPRRTDAKLLKAISHPLRWKILARLNDGVASPVMIAREMDISVPLISYHIKQLRDLDCIELVRTEPRRGATEHFYRAVKRAYLSEVEWSQLSAAEKNSITGSILQEAMADALAAVHSGSIDSRDDRYVVHLPLRIDETGWKELTERVDELYERALELQAESAVRIAEDEAGGPQMTSTLSILHYESTPRAPGSSIPSDPT
jgi:DNA-binding transcriptional ArsR family regulator